MKISECGSVVCLIVIILKLNLQQNKTKKHQLFSFSSTNWRTSHHLPSASAEDYSTSFEKPNSPAVAASIRPEVRIFKMCHTIVQSSVGQSYMSNNLNNDNFEYKYVGSGSATTLISQCVLEAKCRIKLLIFQLQTPKPILVPEKQFNRHQTEKLGVLKL